MASLRGVQEPMSRLSAIVAQRQIFLLKADCELLEAQNKVFVRLCMADEAYRVKVEYESMSRRLRKFIRLAQEP